MATNIEWKYDIGDKAWMWNAEASKPVEVTICGLVLDKKFRPAYRVWSEGPVNQTREVALWRTEAELLEAIANSGEKRPSVETDSPEEAHAHIERSLVASIAALNRKLLKHRWLREDHAKRMKDIERQIAACQARLQLFRQETETG